MVFQPGQKVITEGADVTDDMLMPLDTGGAVTAAITVEALAEYIQAEDFSDLPLSKTTSQAAVTTIQVGGLTGAQVPCQILTGAVAPVTVYFPSAADIAAAAVASGIAVGQSYQARIVNTLSTTGVMTMGASAGITLSGLATLTGQNSFGVFNISIVSLTAVTITRVG